MSEKSEEYEKIEKIEESLKEPIENEHKIESFSTPNRFFEWNEKSFQDTKQLLDDVLDKEKFDRWANLCNPDHPTYDIEAGKSLDMLHFPVGKTLMLEVTVVNTWMSRMLQMMIYNTSKYSKQNNLTNKELNAFGVKFDAIHWGSIYSFNDGERALIQQATELINRKFNSDSPINTESVK